MRRWGSQIARGEEAVLALHGCGDRVGVHHRGPDERVAELIFDGEDMRATDGHVGSERVSNQMRPDALLDMCPRVSCWARWNLW